MTASPETFLDGRVSLWAGDCLDVLQGLERDSVDACVTDPPYGIGFMGKAWDHGVPGLPYWKQVLRVLKPGGHLLAFGGTRTYHRMACAIEDAGFEIRDSIQWLYGSGFPKSLDVSKAIDKAAGAERERSPVVAMQTKGAVGEISSNVRCANCGKARASGNPCTCPRLEDVAITPQAAAWDGFGTALKPACEPIVLARKPLIGTVADNVLKLGTGALNIDRCRVETAEDLNGGTYSGTGRVDEFFKNKTVGASEFKQPSGRWPANVIHDGSEVVVGAFPDNLSSGTGAIKKATGAGTQANAYGKESRPIGTPNIEYGDCGSAARFFYTAKADAEDRLGSKHPTVKPVDLMQYLVRLVTPPGGLVLDPFAGTGTTGEAAWREGMRCTLIQRGASPDEIEYLDDIRRRMRLCLAGPQERKRESAKARPDKPFEPGSLFGGAE